MADAEGATIDGQGRLITSVTWEGPDGITATGMLVEWHDGPWRHTAVRSGGADGEVVFDTSAHPELYRGHAQPLRNPGMRELGRRVLETLAYLDGERIFASWFD